MVARRPVTRGRYTAAELGKRFGKSPRTIRNYVAEPRATYQARSVERLQPWAALGVSRRTWYRRHRRGAAALAAGIVEARTVTTVSGTSVSADPERLTRTTEDRD
jgi:hypothetical protein